MGLNGGDTPPTLALRGGDTPLTPGASRPFVTKVTKGDVVL